MFDVYKQFKVDYFEYHTFLTLSLLLELQQSKEKIVLIHLNKI